MNQQTPAGMISGAAMHNGVMTRYLFPEGKPWNPEEATWVEEAAALPPAQQPAPPTLDFSSESEQGPVNAKAYYRSLGQEYQGGRGSDYDTYKSDWDPGHGNPDAWFQDHSLASSTVPTPRGFGGGGMGSGGAPGEITGQMPSMGDSGGIFNNPASTGGEIAGAGGAGYGGITNKPAQESWGASYGGIGMDPWLTATQGMRPDNFLKPFEQMFKQLPVFY